MDNFLKICGALRIFCGFTYQRIDWFLAKSGKKFVHYTKSGAFSFIVSILKQYFFSIILSYTYF